jgi:hypothetical protein
MIAVLETMLTVFLMLVLSFVFKSRNRKKSHGLISWLYGGWDVYRNWQL